LRSFKNITSFVLTVTLRSYRKAKNSTPTESKPLTPVTRLV